MTTHGLDAPDTLTDGRWAPDGLILRWEPAPPTTPPTTGGRPRIPFTMTRLEARRARYAYQRGDHSAWAVQGNREYQRAWRRARRAA